MKTKKTMVVLCTGALVACVALAACTSGGTDAGSSDDAATTTVEYSDDSLIAFHESNGQDISGLTEISVEACGECHGDLADIKEATEDVLDDGVFTANPHTNHMYKYYECSDCHSLTGSQALTCNTTCHSWEVTTGTDIWNGVSDLGKDADDDEADDEAEE